MQILVIQHLTAVTWEFMLHNQSKRLTRVLKPANDQTLTIGLPEKDFSVKRISNMTKDNPPILH